MGGYDTVLTSKEFRRLYGAQERSMTAVRQASPNYPAPAVDETEEDAPRPTKAKPAQKQPKKRP